MGLPGIVLTSFVGAHNLLSIDHHGQPVEALLERLSNQGSGCGMNVLQLLPPLFVGNATLQDPGVASLVELPLNNDEILGSACDPPGLRLVCREHFAKKPIEVRDPPVS